MREKQALIKRQTVEAAWYAVSGARKNSSQARSKEEFFAAARG